MTDAVELRPNRPLHELLTLYHSGPGIDEVRELAALRVGDLDADHAKAFGRTVSDWSTADIGDELRKAFDVDAFALLAGAWGQVRKVRKAIGASRATPPRTETVSLVKHDLEASLSPRLVLCVAGVDWCSVELTLGLVFSLDFAHLEIHGGQLRALRLGAPSGSITLKCQGKEVAAFKRTIKLASEYRFDPPLGMDRRDAARTTSLDDIQPTG